MALGELLPAVAGPHFIAMERTPWAVNADRKRSKNWVSENTGKDVILNLSISYLQSAIFIPFVCVQWTTWAKHCPELYSFPLSAAVLENQIIKS